MNRNDTVASLREQIESKYKEALHALDVLKAYLAETAVNMPQIESINAVVRSPTVLRKQTKVRQVLAAVSTEFKSVEQLAKELPFGEAKIRAVLYSKTVRERVDVQTEGKRKVFRLKSAGASDSVSHLNGDSVSVAERVRNLLYKNPNGLRFGEFHDALDKDALQSGHGIKAIDAALAGMKRRGKMLYDVTTGIYSLPKPKITLNP